LPGAEFDAAARARALVAEAEAEARRIRGEAADEAARARAQGLEEGWQAGRARAAAELVRAAEARDRLLAAARGDLLDAAAALAERVLGREVDRDGDAVVALAERALAEVRGFRRVTLRAHPADAGRLRAMAGRKAAPAVAVREDPAVRAGGVVVETEAGELDGRIEAQVEALRRALDALEEEARLR
jgi:flagellar biosynthesis/type III secretory pathway protein FliH